uniref:CDC42 small effector 1 n=1 Tax=Oryzias latipes TaxID=8090 RepID=A0A3P9KPL7_ORYLA
MKFFRQKRGWISCLEPLLTERERERQADFVQELQLLVQGLREPFSSFSAVTSSAVKLEAAPLKTTDFGFEDYLQSAVPRPACRVEAQPNGRLQDRQSITMSDFWHKMGCCVVAKPPPKKKRRKIDRSMIGEPTNFIHLTHIGSGEMAEGLQPSGPVQEQMRSKGPNTNVRNSLL